MVDGLYKLGQDPRTDEALMRGDRSVRRHLQHGVVGAVMGVDQVR